MSYISKIEPECKSKADRVIHDWALHAGVGDIARSIFAPSHTSRAFYGGPISDDHIYFLEALLSGADVAIVQSFKHKIVVLPEVSFTAIMEGRHD